MPKTDGGEPCLTDRHNRFTKRLVQSFETWGRSVPGYSEGMPVGASASRIVANVLLLDFDRLVRKNLMPIYYARYVDDIFLVLRDNGCFRTGSEVVDWIVERMNGLISPDQNSGGNFLTVNLPYVKSSQIEFQTAKQRVFLIDNTDLLDAIKSKVDEVTSEWRLLPDCKQMERTAAAKALSTSRDGNSDGDALRKTDTLLLKRLSFAILLRVGFGHPLLCRPGQQQNVRRQPRSRPSQEVVVKGCRKGQGRATGLDQSALAANHGCVAGGA